MSDSNKIARLMTEYRATVQAAQIINAAVSEGTSVTTVLDPAVRKAMVQERDRLAERQDLLHRKLLSLVEGGDRDRG